MQYKIPTDTFINRFMKATNYIPAIKKHTPDLLEEIKGIAEGADIDFDTIFVFQFFDEVGAQGESVAANRCSSLGLSHKDGEPTIVAQNNDLEIFRDGYQVVLHIKDGEEQPRGPRSQQRGMYWMERPEQQTRLHLCKHGFAAQQLHRWIAGELRHSRRADAAHRKRCCGVRQTHQTCLWCKLCDWGAEESSLL